MHKTEREIRQRVSKCHHSSKAELAVQGELPGGIGPRVYFVECRQQYPGVLQPCVCAGGEFTVMGRAGYTSTKRAPVERRLEIVAAAWNDRPAKHQ